MPEAADYVAKDPEESRALAQPLHASVFVRGLCAAAKTNHLAINVGVHEPAETLGRIRNLSLWIDAEGKIVQQYQKLHLFQMETEDGGFEEGKTVEQGGALVPPFETPAGRMGLMICFDLRFPALSSKLCRLGAQTLSIPAAWTQSTGDAGHWECLLRARAIENQCFVVAADQVGEHEGGRTSYGRSMIIDPWGKVLAQGRNMAEFVQSGCKSELLVADIDIKQVTETRNRMRLHERIDVLVRASGHQS